MNVLSYESNPYSCNKTSLYWKGPLLRNVSLVIRISITCAISKLGNDNMYRVYAKINWVWQGLTKDNVFPYEFHIKQNFMDNNDMLPLQVIYISYNWCIWSCVGKLDCLCRPNVLSSVIRTDFQLRHLDVEKWEQWRYVSNASSNRYRVTELNYLVNV